MESFLLVGLGFTGIALTLYGIYQVVVLDEEVGTASKRSFFPLHTESSKRFHFMNSSDDDGGGSGSGGYQKSFNVLDDDGRIIYQFILKESKWDWFEQDWILQDRKGVDIATVHLTRIPLRKCHVYFTIESQNDPGTLQASANHNHHLHQHRSQLENPSPIADIYGNSNSGIMNESAITSSLGSPYEVITPYIDSSLARNSFIKQSELGQVEKFPLHYNNPIKTFEKRKLHKIQVDVNKSFRSCSFHLNKGSYEYRWRPNGYLEKEALDSLDPSSERIGMVKFHRDGKGDFWLILNQDRMAESIGVSTTFLHYKLGLWEDNFKIIEKNHQRSIGAL